MSSDLIVLYLLNMLFYASMLFMISSGLNLIYGVMRILNIAHGAFYAFGAYAGAWVVSFMLVDYYPLLFLVFPLVGTLAAVIVSSMLESTLINPVYRRREEYQLLLTFGILLILEDSLKAIWGSTPLSAVEPFRVLGSIEITRITYPVYNLVIILAGFITALTLWIYITKTKTGVVMRAVASDYEMALALGVNIRKVYMQTFIIASAIAGFAGAIIVPTSAAVLGMSIEILILAFVVIVIGGLGSIKGAFLGSLLVGLTRVIGVTYFPKIELVILYAVAAIILIIRPRGLFGK